MGTVAAERLTKFTLWTIALLIVGGTIYALRYVRGYRPFMSMGIFDSAALPADIALRFDSVRVNYRENNKVAWTLKAGRVETNQDRSRLVFSNGMTATLMNEGRPRATVTAPNAVYDTSQHLLDVNGQTVCHVFPQGATRSQNSDDLVLQAQSVQWNTSTHSVSCRGAVSADLPRKHLRGNDFSVDLLTRDMSINHFSADFTIDATSDSQQLQPLKGIIP